MTQTELETCLASLTSENPRALLDATKLAEKYPTELWEYAMTIAFGPNKMHTRLFDVKEGIEEAKRKARDFLSWELSKLNKAA